MVQGCIMPDILLEGVCAISSPLFGGNLSAINKNVICSDSRS